MRERLTTKKASELLVSDEGVNMNKSAAEVTQATEVKDELNLAVSNDLGDGVAPVTSLQKDDFAAKAKEDATKTASLIKAANHKATRCLVATDRAFPKVAEDVRTKLAEILFTKLASEEVDYILGVQAKIAEECNEEELEKSAAAPLVEAKPSAEAPEAPAIDVTTKVDEPEVKADETVVTAKVDEPEVKADETVVTTKVDEPEVKADETVVTAKVDDPEVKADETIVTAKADEPEGEVKADETKDEVPAAFNKAASVKTASIDSVFAAVMSQYSPKLSPIAGVRTASTKSETEALSGLFRGAPDVSHAFR